MIHDSTPVHGRTELDVVVSTFSVAITATTPVDASPAVVWAILADTASYPSWNPFVRRLEGRIELGSRITVTMKPGRREQVLRPRIVEVQPGRSFTWQGRVGVPGLLDGRHTFTVEPAGGSAVLVQHEVLSGALVPLFRTMLVRDTPSAFTALNDALAARARDRSTLRREAVDGSAA